MHSSELKKKLTTHLVKRAAALGSHAKTVKGLLRFLRRHPAKMRTIVPRSFDYLHTRPSTVHSWELQERYRTEHPEFRRALRDPRFRRRLWRRLGRFLETLRELTPGPLEGLDGRLQGDLLELNETLENYWLEGLRRYAELGGLLPRRLLGLVGFRKDPRPFKSEAWIHCTPDLGLLDPMEPGSSGNIPPDTVLPIIRAKGWKCPPGVGMRQRRYGMRRLEGRLWDDDDVNGRFLGYQFTNWRPGTHQTDVHAWSWVTPDLRTIRHYLVDRWLETSWTLPEGMRFGRDREGLYLEIPPTDEDPEPYRYHPTYREFLEDTVEEALRVSGDHRKARLQHRRRQAQQRQSLVERMRELRETIAGMTPPLTVSLYDSVAAGNCLSGTQAFCARVLGLAIPSSERLPALEVVDRWLERSVDLERSEQNLEASRFEAVFHRLLKKDAN